MSGPLSGVAGVVPALTHCGLVSGAPSPHRMRRCALGPGSVISYSPGCQTATETRTETVTCPDAGEGWSLSGIGPGRLAEDRGFEPLRVFSPTRFPIVRPRPLGESSAEESSHPEAVREASGPTSLPGRCPAGARPRVRRGRDRRGQGPVRTRVRAG